MLRSIDLSARMDDFTFDVDVMTESKSSLNIFRRIKSTVHVRRIDCDRYLFEINYILATRYNIYPNNLS